MLNWVELGEVKRAMKEKGVDLIFSPNEIELFDYFGETVQVYSSDNTMDLKIEWYHAPKTNKYSSGHVFFKAYVDCLTFKPN